MRLPIFDGVMGFVLAGGRSQRMGTDKALLEFAGKPMIRRALDLFEASGIEACIAGARTDLSAFGRVITDQETDRGPLAGICAAFQQTSAEVGIFISVDVPLLPPPLPAILAWNALQTGSVVTALTVHGDLQTFPVAVRRSALPVLERELRGERRGCLRAFAAAAAAAGESIRGLPLELLAQAGQIEHPKGVPASRWLFNANTPEEIARASAYLDA